MRAADWLEHARRRCSADLFLCRNQVQARKIGVHPECIQVWDKAPGTHEPYFVVAIHAGGFPRDPSDLDVDVLQRMSADRMHQGRASWVEEFTRSMQEHEERKEKEYAKDVHDWFSPGGAGHDRAMHATKNHIVVAQKAPEFRRGR